MRVDTVANNIARTYKEQDIGYMYVYNCYLDDQKNHVRVSVDANGLRGAWRVNRKSFTTESIECDLKNNST